jgi:hypothetical protein
MTQVEKRQSAYMEAFKTLSKYETTSQIQQTKKDTIKTYARKDVDAKQ